MQTDTLEITRIGSPAELEPYLNDWRQLAAGRPMRLPEWILGWWHAYATSQDELWLLFLQAPDGELVGLAPLYRQGAGGRGIFRILGAAEACSHHQDWFCANGWEIPVGSAVARFLLDCKSRWRRLYFESIDADAVAIKTTVDILAGHGCLRHQRQINSGWKITLPESWDDYLMMLSGSLRKKCRKLQRRFFDSGKVRVRQVETEADLEEGFAILLKLHAARWGDPRQPLGVFDDERFRSFHEKVSLDLLAQGKLRLAWLECEGRALAVEYQLVDSKTVYAYQAGADLTMATYSPGKLTMMAAIQFALARGCKYFDLLGGDEPYKANWRAVPQARHDHRVWQQRGLGFAHWGLWNCYTLAVRRLKPIIPPQLVNKALKLAQATKNILFGRPGS